LAERAFGCNNVTRGACETAKRAKTGFMNGRRLMY